MGNRGMFVTRTIRNGQVKIYGHYYKPSDVHMKYDGRLDGLRYVFGIYPYEERFVGLWGSEKMAKAESEEEFQRLRNESKEVVDGRLPWSVWYRVETTIEGVTPGRKRRGAAR